MRYVAFVRAVMVGRESLHRPVLLDAFSEAGATDPVSHLATGNVSFDIAVRSLPELVEQVDASLTAIVGRDIEVFVRRLDDLGAIDADAVYATAPFDGVEDRLVTYFHHPPDGIEVPSVIQGGRCALVELRDTDLYTAAREVDGRVGAPGGVLEKLTGQRVTTRAWSTVEKIVRAHE